MFMMSWYADTSLLRTWMVAWKLMLAFCIEIIMSDRLTLSSPIANFLPMSSACTWLVLTPSSAFFSASENSTLVAGGASVLITGGISPGRVACAFNWAIMAWIWLPSIPPVFISLSILLLRGTNSHVIAERGVTIRH